MRPTSIAAKSLHYPPRAGNDNDAPDCDWESLRKQLLEQWNKLSPADLDRTGSDRHGIALLVGRAYGISAPLVENYLANMERTLPL